MQHFSSNSVGFGLFTQSYFQVEANKVEFCSFCYGRFAGEIIHWLLLQTVPVFRVISLVDTLTTLDLFNNICTSLLFLPWKIRAIME